MLYPLSYGSVTSMIKKTTAEYQTFTQAISDQLSAFNQNLQSTPLT